MGLLERALKYKKQLNESGKETLIDRITGPAESRFKKNNNSEIIDINDFDNYDLSDNREIFIDIQEAAEDLQMQTPEPEVLKEETADYSEPIYDKKQINSDSVFSEEEILLLDDGELHPSQKVDNEIIATQNNKSAISSISDSRSISDDVITPAENEKVNVVKKSEVIDENITDDYSYQMPEFNDYAVLFEILKEFIQSESVEEIYSTILFSVMGQLGVSSASILSPSEEDQDKWVISQSNGIKIPESELEWDVSSGILEILKVYQGVIDVEDLKEDASLRDDYYRFISANARLIVPVMFSGNLAGVIMVGEKLDSEDFTPSEIEFLSSLSETASSTMKAISTYEKSNTELLGLRIEKEILFDVEIMQQTLLAASSGEELEEIIRKNFYSLGIESYAIFLEEPLTGNFYPGYHEIDDYLGWQGAGFRIKRENRLVSFLLNKKTSIMLDNFMESSVMIETFGLGRVEKMSVFIAYPLIISGKLSGFLALFRINPAVEVIDVDIRLQRIVRFIFPYIYHFKAIDPEKNKCEDLTGSIYSRIESEFKKASDMNIPVSLISLSVKNYKRYYDRFGKIEMNKLFDGITDIIKNRLSSGEFAVRIDRNKFVIILPGKDKKYSTTLSGILKNQISEKFNSTDFKLLLAFISAVYPEDGQDLFSILEILD